MEDRYRKMSKMGVRNMAGYNEKVAEAKASGEVMTRTQMTGYDKESGEPIFETHCLYLNLKNKASFVLVNTLARKLH